MRRGEHFSPTDYFLKPVLLTSSSGCQTALSSELSRYSPLDMAVTALTSPVSSPHLREGKGSRCSPWKGHYLRSSQGIPCVFWSQTMKHSGNGMMPSNGIFPRSQIYHRMDQTHYMTRGHVCTQRLNFALSHRTGTYLPLLQRDWCTPFTWRTLSLWLSTATEIQAFLHGPVPLLCVWATAPPLLHYSHSHC